MEACIIMNRMAHTGCVQRGIRKVDVLFSLLNKAKMGLIFGKTRLESTYPTVMGTYDTSISST